MTRTASDILGVAPAAPVHLAGVGCAVVEVTPAGQHRSVGSYHRYTEAHAGRSERADYWIALGWELTGADRCRLSLQLSNPDNHNDRPTRQILIVPAASAVWPDYGVCTVCHLSRAQAGADRCDRCAPPEAAATPAEAPGLMPVADAIDWHELAAAQRDAEWIRAERLAEALTAAAAALATFARDLRRAGRAADAGRAELIARSARAELIAANMARAARDN